jgi:hypothetical protein
MIANGFAVGADDSFALRQVDTVDIESGGI